MTFPQGSSPKVQKVIQEFLALSLEEKRKKLKEIAKQLEKGDIVFANMSNKLAEKDIQEEVLDIWYYDIMIFSQAIEEYNKTKSTEALNKAQSYLEKMRILEQEERKVDIQDIENMEKMIQNS